MSAPPHPAYLRRDGVVVSVPRKCGFNSVKQALKAQGGFEYIESPEGLNGDVLRVAVVRHPVDRLVSCWRDKVWKRWMPSLKVHGIQPKMSFSDFADIVLATPDAESNCHFVSYAPEVVDLGPDVVIRTESLSEEWSFLEREMSWNAAGIERFNATGGRPEVTVSEAQRHAILGRYADDLDLWRSAGTLTEGDAE